MKRVKVIEAKMGDQVGHRRSSKAHYSLWSTSRMQGFALDFAKLEERGRTSEPTRPPSPVLVSTY